MSSPYVCYTCRRELQRRVARARISQWLPRASFISFNEIVPPRKESEQSGDAGSSPPAQIQSRFDDNRSTVGGRYSKFVSARQTTSRARETPRQETLATSSTPPASETVRGKGSKSLQSSLVDDLDHLVPPFVQSQSVEGAGLHQLFLDGHKSIQDSPVHKIQAILSTQGHDAADAWAIFTQAYPAVDGARQMQLSSAERQLIKDKNVWRRLLQSVCFQWTPEKMEATSPVAAIDHFHKLGLMRGSWYLSEILAVIYRMIHFDSKTTDDGERDIRYRLESQTLQLWSHFLRHSSNPSWTPMLASEALSSEGTIDWSGIPNPESLYFAKNLGKDVYQFQYRLHALFQGVPHASKDHLSAAAALTFDYFSHKYCQPYVAADERIVFEPFLKIMIRLLHGAKNFENVIQMSRNLLGDEKVPKKEVQKIATRMQQTQYRAALALAIHSLDVLGGETVNLTPEQEEQLGVYFTTRIKRQVEKENRAVMDQLWRQAILTYSSPATTDGRPSSSVMPARIYSAFLFGWRELLEPEKQADVWNHMIASKVTPSADQWGLMISARTRNLSALEHLWGRMIASGTKPTHQTWCTRISAFIYNGNPEEGIQLLYQWGNLWLSEVRTIFEAQNVEMPDVYRLNRDGPTVPRPNADTLTTVITALVQRKNNRAKRLDLVPDAFAWAHQFGVKPNVWVYNILFRTCLKDGNLKEAMQILSKMEDDKVQPDAYTFYGFADYVFKSGNENGLSEKDQYNLIFSILDMLEERGLEPNPVFFGTMIDGLLRLHNNTQAAYLLLKIMMDKNMTIPPPVWTSFITFYFSEAEATGTPDWNAIDALWRRMQQYERLSLDAIFYDRMIEGYAHNGDVVRAAAFLDRMSKEGKRPGWPALSAMLEGYIQASMMDAATALVTDVLSGAGVVHAGIRTARGGRMNPDKERFFSAANSAGLVSTGAGIVGRLEEMKAVSAGLGMEELAAVEGQLPTDEFTETSDVKSEEQIEALYASPGLDLSGDWKKHVESVQ